MTIFDKYNLNTYIMKVVYRVNHSQWRKTGEGTMTSSEMQTRFFTNLLKAWKYLDEVTREAETTLPSYSTVARSIKEAKDINTMKCETATGYVWYSIWKCQVL